MPESPVSSALPQRALPQKPWRFAVCSACYVFLYFWRGMIIFPFVRDFTLRSTCRARGQIIAMQFLVRGPMFIVVCLVLLRMFRLSHLSGAFAVGLAFTLMSGVAVLDHAERVLPRPGSLGTLLRSHQLELCVWVYGGMGVGPCTGVAS